MAHSRGTLNTGLSYVRKGPISRGQDTILALNDELTDVEHALQKANRAIAMIHPDMQPDGGWWESSRFPANTLGEYPGKEPDYDDWGLPSFKSSGKVQMVGGVYQFPHGWKVGTNVFPHVHWKKATSGAGDVAWVFEFYRSPMGEIDQAVDSLTAHTVGEYVDDDGAADRHLVTPFGETPASSMNSSDILLFRIWRDTDAAEDTYAGAAVLLEFNIQMLFDYLGSQDYRGDDLVYAP